MFDAKDYEGTPIADDPDGSSEALRNLIRDHAEDMGEIRSLDASTWTVEANDSTKTRATAYHRDSISRIVFTTDGPGVDTDVTLEVYAPLPADNPTRDDPDDANDILVGKPMNFSMLSEAVWQAEYFARRINRGEFGGLAGSDDT